MNKVGLNNKKVSLTFALFFLFVPFFSFSDTKTLTVNWEGDIDREHGYELVFSGDTEPLNGVLDFVMDESGKVVLNNSSVMRVNVKKNDAFLDSFQMRVMRKDYRFHVQDINNFHCEMNAAADQTYDLCFMFKIKLNGNVLDYINRDIKITNTAEFNIVSDTDFTMFQGNIAVVQTHMVVMTNV